VRKGNDMITGNPNFDNLPIQEKIALLEKFNNHRGDYTKPICMYIDCSKCPFYEMPQYCHDRDNQERYEQVQIWLAELREEQKSEQENIKK
jgi:hypothetical protein